MPNTFHPGPSPVTAEQRIVLMTDVQWESFILECCEQLTVENLYVQVKRLGGPGDKGRDVAGYMQFPPVVGEWDLYQAKAYSEPLTPDNLLADLAKFLFNVFSETYPLPRTYFICGKKDVGTKLFTLLEKPEELRNWVLDKWKEKTGKFGSFTQPLSPELQEFVTAFDFTIIKEIRVADLLEIHARGPKHWPAFGVLPLRGPDPTAPSEPTLDEQTYVGEILRAYSDAEGCTIAVPGDVPSKHKRHFEGCRNQFYFAEGLSRFSRDYVPNAFDNLLGEVRVGISPVVDDISHQNGLKRLIETIKYAPSLSATNNPLKDRIRALDLQGACHHLANRGEVTWVYNDEE